MLISREKLADWLWGTNKVGFTSGAFDILHLQHIKYLQAAKRKCDVLVVGINTDESVRKLKGDKRPIVPELERAEIVGALGCVDYVFLFNETTNQTNIEILQPDYYIKGGDYKPEQLKSAKIMEDWGGEAVIIPPEDLTASTTNIIEIILDRYAVCNMQNQH